MRTLVVDALRVLGRPTGPGRYVEFLTQQWSQMSVPFDRIVLMSPRPPQIDLPGTQTMIEFRAFGARWSNFAWEQFLLPRAARGAAMLYCPTYTVPLLYSGPQVVANHGIYESFPTEFSWRQRLGATPLHRASVRRASRVIVNSISTKNDLVRHFRLSPSAMDIIYPAAHDRFFQSYSREEIAVETTKAFGRDVPYIIFVGKLSKRRNVPNLIKAFAGVRRETKIPHHLLVVGPNTTETPVLQIAAEAGIGDVVKYIDYIEQAPLAKLYAGATLYALPTIHEGISHTMFEAMAAGTAVLTTDHSTLAEGGADAVYSVPTPSIADLTRGLTALLTDENLRREYARKGRKRAERFSWRSAAEQVLTVLDRYAMAADSARI